MYHKLPVIFFLFYLTFFFPFYASAFFFNKKDQDKYKKETFVINDAVKRYLVKSKNSRGTITINILEIDLSNENVSLMVGLPDKRNINKKSTLSNIVMQEMAFAGINANYFEKDGTPLGLLISDGSLITGPIYSRVAIGFSEDKNIFIDQVMLEADVTVSRGFFKKKPLFMVTFDCLNTSSNHCQNVSLLDLKWSKKIKLPKNKLAFRMEKNCLESKDTRTVNRPSTGFLLVGNKKGTLGQLKTNDCLDIAWKTLPDWSIVKEAISGGPYLLMSGEVYIDEENEHIHFGKKDHFAPRSAIGIDEKKKLYLVAVDGRQENYSVGFSLIEFADFLKDFGIKDAINLDGGGSTEIVLNGEVLNKPSDGEERLIGNALLIFYDATAK